MCSAPQEQMAEECLKINDLILSTYADFGFDGEMTVKLSTRPEKRVGSDEAWDHAEGIMMDVLKQIEATVAATRRSRPRSIRAKARSTDRNSNMCCAMPSAATGNAAPRRSTSTCRSGSRPSTSPPTARRQTPVMIHRAICGSMERFLGVVLEHYAGHLPLWLAPKQAVICTIVSDADDYAHEAMKAATATGPSGLDRSSQREDQLQGARAFARQGPGAAGGRQEGGRRSARSRSAASAARASR